MFKKILFPLDGTDTSGPARSWIKHHAPRDRAEIVLLRVIDTTLLHPELVKSVLQVAQDHLQQVERDLNFTGIPCKMVVRSGKPVASIVKEAEEDAADLVVLSSPRHSEVPGREPETVADEVLRQCPAPVLLLRPTFPAGSGERVRRVIVPLDHAAEETVTWAARFARSHRAQLIFLVLQARRHRGSSAGHDEHLDLLRLRMMQTCSELAEQGLKISLRVLRGDPSTCTLASTGPSDLLLLTASTHQDPERILLRGVEEMVLRESEVPVIVLKESRGPLGLGRRRVSGA